MRIPLPRDPRLYGIIDTGYLGGRTPEFFAEQLAAGGAEVVQLRAKGVAPAEIAAMGRAILPILRAAGIPLIINDHPAVAREIGADGVHVGQDDLSVAEARALAGGGGQAPPPIVGKSTHSPAQALAAVAEGADYIGFGPLFATPTKPDYPPIGMEDIGPVVAAAGLPVFCIGGIKLENLRQVVAAGARSVVVVSGILQSARPREYCLALRQILEPQSEPRPVAQIIDDLRRAGVLGGGEVSARPLSGGVSCDIWLVEEGGRRAVVKQALPKLRVRDDWYADVGRNATEQAYLRYVAGFRPDAVPRILHGDGGAGFFAMEYLGEGFENWKAQMLGGRADPETARRAGALLGEIHRRSWGDEDLLKAFDTTRNFHQLRTESYLLTTGRRHPPLRELFDAEAARMEGTRLCLVHGDYSPKNILVAAERIVLLDCEVAWYGEPAFDTAFLLNHLHLKALHRPDMARAFLALASEAWAAYREALGDARLGDLDARTARLLLMQMLARVDGKSPVEYLAREDRKDLVRGFVSRHLPGGLWREGLAAVSEAWGRMIPAGG